MAGDAKINLRFMPKKHRNMRKKSTIQMLFTGEMTLMTCLESF